MNWAPSVHKNILNHPEFAFMTRRIIQFTGLAYYDNHLEDLAQSINTRMAQLDIQALSDYATLLDDGEYGRPEFDELVKLLTIGETHFFRHRNLMEALRRDVLPNLIKHRSKEKHLRIWCAGCSIGAEPYTVAIILRKYLGARIRDWKITILGTDINRDFLAQAAEGRYSAWALRGIDESIRNSCFHYDDSHWNIKDIYKDDVQFQYHNLATDPTMFASEHGDAFDLILCRNVFIYFDSKLIKQITGRFKESLNDDGYLAIGHSEMNTTHFGDFIRNPHSGVPIFRKGETVSHWTRCLPYVNGVQKITSPISSTSVNISNSTHRQEPRSTDRFADVDRCANEGELDRAIELCTDVILKNRLDLNAYLRQAMLHQAQGHLDKAAHAARTAIYLDRSSPVAHYLHGAISQQQGRENEAIKSFRRAVDLLDQHDTSTIIDNHSDMTAGDLLRIVQTHMHEEPIL